jgi:hypothetical protein
MTKKKGVAGMHTNFVKIISLYCLSQVESGLLSHKIPHFKNAVPRAPGICVASDQFHNLVFPRTCLIIFTPPL